MMWKMYCHRHFKGITRYGNSNRIKRLWKYGEWRKGFVYFQNEKAVKNDETLPSLVWLLLDLKFKTISVYRNQCSGKFDIAKTFPKQKH